MAKLCFCLQTLFHYDLSSVHFCGDHSYSFNNPQLTHKIFIKSHSSKINFVNLISSCSNHSSRERAFSSTNLGFFNANSFGEKKKCLQSTEGICVNNFEVEISANSPPRLRLPLEICKKGRNCSLNFKS